MKLGFYLIISVMGLEAWQMTGNDNETASSNSFHCGFLLLEGGAMEKRMVRNWRAGEVQCGSRMSEDTVLFSHDFHSRALDVELGLPMSMAMYHMMIVWGPDNGRRQAQ